MCKALFCFVVVYAATTQTSPDLGSALILKWSYHATSIVGPDLYKARLWSVLQVPIRPPAASCCWTPPPEEQGVWVLSWNKKKKRNNVNKDEITSKTRQALFLMGTLWGSTVPCYVTSVSARCSPFFKDVGTEGRERVLLPDPPGTQRCRKDITKCMLSRKSLCAYMYLYHISTYLWTTFEVTEEK